MSNTPLFEKKFSPSKSKNKIVYFISQSNNFQIQNLNVSKKINFCSSLNVKKDNIDESGFIKDDRKSRSNNLCHSEPKLKGKIIKLNNIDCMNKNLSVIQKNNRNFSLYDKNYEANLLESREDNFKEFGAFSKNAEFNEHLYKDFLNKNIYNQILGEIPLISRLFSKFSLNVNNNIATNFINKKNRLESLKPSIFKNIIIRKKSLTNVQNFETKDKNELISKNQNRKINLNIPENFLINFNIIKINVKKIELSQNDEQYNSILLNDMEIFINNLCDNINKNFFFSCNDYIECKKLDSEEKIDNFFLNKKRKLSFDFNKFENNSNNKFDLGKTKSKIKRKPYKKKNKKYNKKISLKEKKLNKINNKKDGKKINLYLNQIQINKKSLENFPFCPMLNSKENVKIEFLKAIIEKKELIRINKHTKLIKDKGNLKYIKNKKFEITYQKKDFGNQYILHINGYNILYLILFYYYQIQEGVKLINKFNYSHASLKKSKNVKNLIEELIKKCNKIVKEISN